MKNYDLYATMGTGFEAVVAKELQNLGYNTTTENGRVFFKGDIEDIIKTNINLRTADRIKILLKEFKALDFEAKETKNRKSFPLKNFHEHQIIHLQKCLEQKGICFAIIRFVTLNRYFITPASYLIRMWYSNSKKSLSLIDIINNSYEIKSGYNPTLSYLDGVDKFIIDRI